MQPECEAFREELAERPAESAVLGASAREHVAECERCQAWVAGREARWERIATALQGLIRQEAPAELDGRVVATLFAGERQERAVRSVRALDPVAAPTDLDDRLDRVLVGADRVFRLQAPEELDRRVDRDLRDQARTVVGRHVRGLERLSAPAELEARVARALAVGPVKRRPTLVHWGLAAAAGLVAALGSGVFSPSSSDSHRAETAALPLSFRIVPVSDPRELSGMARALIEPAWGGILSEVDHEGEKL